MRVALIIAIAATGCVAAAGLAVDEGITVEARHKFIHQLEHSNESTNNGLGFWIELERSGKRYHCNNKVKFRSGDRIRFHIVPDTDGYAYLLLKKGSSGGSGVLFPESEEDRSNLVKRGVDYAIPKEASLEFDKTPGIEKVGLLFSRERVEADKYLNIPAEHTIYVAHERAHAGAKALLPQGKSDLSCDDPEPVLYLEPDSAEISHPAKVSALVKDHSLITAVDADTKGVLSVEVSLQHH